MLSKIHLPVLFCLIFWADFRLSAHQTLVPFSSDVTYTVNGETHTGTIYSDGHSVRAELEGRVPGQESITFLRLDSGLAQFVIPQLRAYSEYPYGAPTDAQFISYLRDAKVKSERLGAELVDGQECEKVLVTSTYKDHMYSSIEWRARRLHGSVIKSQDVERQWSTEYRNIHLGAQTASLFQLPAGYMPIAYSQDWTTVVRQMQIAGDLSQRIAIARKAGLKVVGYDGTETERKSRSNWLVTENTPLVFGVRIIDPVTGSDLMVGPHVYTTLP